MSEAVAELTLSFIREHPDAAARVLDELDTVPAAEFFRAVPARLAAPVLTSMHPDQAARAVGALEPVLGAAIVRAMPYLDCVTVLRLVSDRERAAIFNELPTRVARDVSSSLAYPKITVGAWMETSIAAFRTTSRVADALRYVRRNEAQTLSHVFVIAAGRQLQGAVTLANLIRCDTSTRLADIQDVEFVTLSNRARLAEISRLAAWDEFLTLPVVGRKGNVLGGLSRLNLRRGLSANRREARQLSELRTGSHLFDAWLLSAVGLFKALGGQRSH